MTSEISSSLNEYVCITSQYADTIYQVYSVIQVDKASQCSTPHRSIILPSCYAYLALPPKTGGIAMSTSSTQRSYCDQTNPPSSSQPVAVQVHALPLQHCITFNVISLSITPSYTRSLDSHDAKVVQEICIISYQLIKVFQRLLFKEEEVKNFNPHLYNSLFKLLVNEDIRKGTDFKDFQQLRDLLLENKLNVILHWLQNVKKMFYKVFYQFRFQKSRGGVRFVEFSYLWSLRFYRIDQELFEHPPNTNIRLYSDSLKNSQVIYDALKYVFICLKLTSIIQLQSFPSVYELEGLRNTPCEFTDIAQFDRVNKQFFHSIYTILQKTPPPPPLSMELRAVGIYC